MKALAKERSPSVKRRALLSVFNDPTEAAKADVVARCGDRTGDLWITHRLRSASSTGRASSSYEIGFGTSQARETPTYRSWRRACPRWISWRSLRTSSDTRELAE